MKIDIIFLPRQIGDERRLVEAVAADGTDWWNALDSEQRGEIRTDARVAFSEEPDLMDGSKYIYRVSGIRKDQRRLVVAPWWDISQTPSLWLLNRKCAFFDPETGEPLDNEGNRTSPERR